jgi:hypothetical protein
MNIRVCLIASFALLSMSAAFYHGEASTAPASSDEVIQKATPSPAGGSVFSGYRGVTLGTAREETRRKLGEPKEKSDTQDYFVISEGESVQIMYETDGKVRTISTNYFGDHAKPPAAKDIFGIDVASEADGAINKLVRYPKDGFWISYVRTGGKDPMVMITVQKMNEDGS